MIKTGVTELWRLGEKRAEAEASVSEGSHNETLWW